MTENSLTYAGSGVNYDAIDPFKVMAQRAAATTADHILRLNHGNFTEVSWSRGESEYLIETPDYYLAHVEEGLGTKNLVADAMYKLTGKSYYDHIAQDTVAMIVNDMITLGALPLSIAMHLAVGDSKWFNDKKRVMDLIEGWKLACYQAGCVWGGGETPTLKDIINPETCVLSGSAMGIINPKGRLIRSRIQDGDAIIMIGSSGIHANGLTLARQIAEKLPDGYLTKLPSGRTYGDALLRPTRIYVGAIEECLNAGVDIHYAVNITGHGWRKLMRAEQLFSYVINDLPVVPEIFSFLQEHGPIDDREAYGNLNMGAGFALFVSQRDAEDTCLLLQDQLNARIYVAGRVEKSDTKNVVIKPKNIVFEEESMQLR